MAHPGVHLVLTGKDLPIRFGILPVSQDEEALAGEIARYAGDPVAAVIAQDELTAFEALDLMYDLTANLAIGGKYAYRLGQVSLDREDPEFFDNSAHLYVLRSDWRFLPNWEASAEGRMLDLLDIEERRSGAMLTLYRYLGDHFKVGVGYNFTDFSDDLTDLSYDHHGWFLNLVGTL